MTATLRARLSVHLEHIARRYLPTRWQLQQLWHNWLGWAVVLGVVVVVALVVGVVVGRWGG